MKKRLLPNIVLVILGLGALLAAPWQASASLPVRLGAYVPAVLPDPADWPMYGHDYQRTNYNPSETIIGAGNVAQLVQRWQANVGSNGTPTSAAPSVAGGVVYAASSAASPADNFFAFDATTGNPVWHENIGYRSSNCFNVGIGSTPAISGTQVVVGADTASANPAYFGFNTANGAQVWTNLMGVGTSGFPWASAFLFNGRAYVGISSRCDNPSVRGELRAVDMTNGSTVGSAYFVNSGGAGGGIWNSPALSPDGTTIAVGTGEDFSTCTDCSLTRSMVSLDVNSLAVLGHFQEPSPNADQDFGTTPVIFHDSQSRTLVGAGHKNGNFYTYDLSNVSAGPIWTRSGGTSVGLMPAYDPSFGTGGTLFIVNSSITAVDPGNNTVRWGPVSIGSAHGNIAIANGLIFINNGASGLRILNETNGSLLRTLAPANAGGANSGVAVSHGFVYWTSGSYVNAWSLPAGGTPTPTNTVAPTNTPVRTNTPIPSNTPLPSNTPTRTNTAQAATNTPLPSNTPVATSTPIPTNTLSATNTPPPTSTASRTSTPLPSITSIPNTPTRTSTATQTRTATQTNTPLPTQTPGGNTATPVPTDTATTIPIATNTPGVSPTSTVCAIEFTDVPASSTFYTYIRCLACRGIINGYSSGCETGDPCFRPSNNVTRGQIAKIVSNSAGFNDPPSGQLFEDVAPDTTFYTFTQRLASRGFVTGYPCGGVGEPCVMPDNRPYFRPNNSTTRGQLSKIVVNAAGFGGPTGAQIFEDVLPDSTFYAYIQILGSLQIIQGYPCGGAGEPCVMPDNRPYFRPGNTSSRGQTAKIVSNAFLPNCQTPVR